MLSHSAGSFAQQLAQHISWIFINREAAQITAEAIASGLADFNRLARLGDGMFDSGPNFHASPTHLPRFGDCVCGLLRHQRPPFAIQAGVRAALLSGGQSLSRRRPNESLPTMSINMVPGNARCESSTSPPIILIILTVRII